MIRIPRAHPECRILTSVFQPISPSGFDTGMTLQKQITNPMSLSTWPNKQPEKHQSSEQRCYQYLPSPGCSQNNERNLALLSLPRYLC